MSSANSSVSPPGLMATRFLKTLLFETPANDPAIFAAVIGVVTLVSVAATLLPAVDAIRGEVGATLRVT